MAKGEDGNRVVIDGVAEGLGRHARHHPRTIIRGSPAMGKVAQAVSRVVEADAVAMRGLGIEALEVADDVFRTGDRL